MSNDATMTPAPAVSGSDLQRRIADGLFVLQLFCAIGFGIFQGFLMLTTTAGVSLTWLLFWGIFLLINLSLSVRAHQLQPSRITRQTVLTYAAWTVTMIADTGIYVWRDTSMWTSIDNWTAVLALAGIGVTLTVGRRHGLGITDPLVRGYLAVFFKGVPQLMLAGLIALEGGAGLSWFGILTGHLTVCGRLGQIFMSLREAGWDRNRRGSMISEIANELSWIVVTVVWVAAR